MTSTTGTCAETCEADGVVIRCKLLAGHSGAHVGENGDGKNLAWISTRHLRPRDG